MKDFFKNFSERNKPIFTIGLITLVLFLVIIAFYEVKTHKGPGLTKIGNESSFTVSKETSGTGPDAVQQPTQSSSPEQNIDATFGIVGVEFKDNGWVPKITRVVQGQVVKWTNSTAAAIFLKQKTPTYNELNAPVQIDPGKSFNFRMTQAGDWNYEEGVSGYFGTINAFVLAH
jgi:hypothetical protein